MNTHSRLGRRSRVDRDAVFALALQPPQPAPGTPAAAWLRDERAALLSRRGKSVPAPPQVPPT